MVQNIVYLMANSHKTEWMNESVNQSINWSISQSPVECLSSFFSTWLQAHSQTEAVRHPHFETIASPNVSKHRVLNSFIFWFFFRIENSLFASLGPSNWIKSLLHRIISNQTYLIFQTSFFWGLYKDIRARYVPSVDIGTYRYTHHEHHVLSSCNSKLGWQQRDP